MNCSNCNVVNFNSRANETDEIMCKNEHFLCDKCFDSSKTKCIQCKERLFECYKNIGISQHNPNWTYDIIYDWTKMNEKPTQYSSDGYDGEYGVLGDDESINLLLSESKSIDGENLDNSRGIHISNSKRIQEFESINSNTRREINFQDEYLNKENSKFDENLEPIEHITNLVRKDTRQNLLDQEKDKIRGKIEEGILNLFKNEPRTLIKPEEHMCVKKCKTIGVSTESEPKFSPKVHSYNGTKEHIVEVIDFNEHRYNEAPQEYFVMKVDTRHNTNPKTKEKLSGKETSFGVAQPPQQVIETVLQPGTNPMSTMTEDTIFYKMLREKFSKIPPNKIQEIISSICNSDEYKISDVGSIQCQSDLRTEQTKNEFNLVSNSSRASYNNNASIPNPQFQLIASVAKPPAQIIDATTLHIPRSPVICPISSCQQACFVSDFTRHIAVDHTNVPMERTLPRQCKNFFLDPKLIHFGSSRCQMLLLVKDKIRNLGHEKFKDFIPVLAMSTKVRTVELCCSKPELKNAETKNISEGYLMIWLTGLMPTQVPIFFSLIVWARTGNMPSCHIVHSGQLYSIRNSQNATAIQESGQRLLLSQNQVDLLTNNGRNMLELQIVIN